MRDLSTHPWLPFLHRVSQPSRYVGGEWGEVAKPADAPLAARMALVFPDVYEVGMSHLGSQILYALVNGQPDLALERCFAPWDDMEGELRGRGLRLLSLETATPLAAFDAVGFSLQHELSYTNVLNVLDLSGIALLAAERSDRDPIVLGGGPCATHPAPMAPFVDAFFVGEAEADLPDLLRVIGGMRRAGAARDAILRSLAARDGVWCPAVHEPGTRVRRVFLPDLDAFPPPRGGIVAWNRAVFDRVSVELARGCSEGCRFCEAGYTYRPLRDRSPGRVLEDTIASVRAAGYEEVSLGALSPADYPALAPLVHALSREVTPLDVSLSVSSLRAYGLTATVLDDLRSVRASGLTLAPEAGSQRLRNVINKNVTEADMVEAAHRAFSSGWQRIKLYFMLGLPTETDEDAVAIVDLAKSVLRAGRQSGYRAQVTASVGVFVPRPHTPFQREGMAPPETIARRQGLIRDAAKRSGVQVKLAEGRDSRLECALARGNRSLSAVILRAFRAGCRFDNWSERARREVWADAFAAEGIDTDALSRPIPPDATLPWEVVDPLVSRAFLERERERAYSARPLVPCEKPAPRGGVRPGPAEVASARRVVCYACGAGCEPHEVASERAAIVAGGEALAAPRPAAPAGPPRVPVLWHLRYTKTGRAAWLSQKDMVKHLPRVLRRAGLRLDVSHGFHPMPRLSYRPPLPVGYRSVGEWADAVVLLAEGESVSLDALNAASVDGIVFASAERKAKRTRPGDTWRLAFASPVPLTEAVARLAPLPVSALDDDDATGLLAGSDLCVLDWTVTAHPPGRPHEVLSAAFGVPFTPWDLVRLRETPVPEVEVAHDPDPAPCVPLDDDPGAGDDGLLGE